MTDAVSATTAMESASIGETTRLVVPSLPLLQRLRHAIAAFLWSKWMLKPMSMYDDFKKYFSPRAEKDPDLVKSYPVRRGLIVRIFFPPTYDPSISSPQSAKLPTLLTIHGGGFVVGEPKDNDRWNRAFSRRHNFLVVALDYRKAPLNPFPTAIYDIEALASCVLSDPTLPVDPSRVALAGWSAGGNLTLAASQLPSLRHRLRAVVPFYPSTDYVTSDKIKALGRRYKPSLGGFRSRPTDFLLSMIPLFSWAYLSPGQRCDAPLLSPLYAPREDFLRHVFTVACELDMLAPEAERFACKLAGRRVPGLEEPVGREEPVGKGELILEGDERFAWEVTREDGSRYRWLLVPDTIHGFDQENIEAMAQDEGFAEDARIKTAKVIDLVGHWLLDGPFKAKT